MKQFLVILDIVLVLTDVVVYLRLRKIFKEHSQGDKLVVPTKKVMPYVIGMVVISVLLLGVCVCLQLK